jgi:hypothetical protein
LVGSIYGRSSIKFAHLTDQDEMSNLYRGYYKDASNEVTVHLAKPFQRRRILKISPSETRIMN